MFEESPHIHHSRWRFWLTLATFVALAILIYTLRDQIADVIGNLGKVNAAALFLLIPLQLAKYDVYTRLYQSLLKIMGKAVAYKPLYILTLELNFVNNILPSGGLSGISYFNMRAKSEGITTAQSTFANIVKLFLLYLSYQPILVVGLLILAANGHVNNLVLVVATFLITLLIVGTLVAVYIVESRQRVSALLTALTKFLNLLIRLVRPKHPETINIARAQTTFNELHDNYLIIKAKWRQLKLPLLYMTLANISEVVSLYVVYVAFGELVNVGAVILAYAVANFAGLISVLPAGIGVFEGLMTASLIATGIPASLSIPVTIMFRVLSMATQLIPGYYFYQQAVQRGLGAKLK